MLLPQISLLGEQTGSTFAPPNIDGLSDSEQSLIQGLSTKLMYTTSLLGIKSQYYLGLQRLADLGVSVPQQLASVRTVVDWPRIVVDTLHQRQVVEGFRLPGATDVDSDLWQFWQENNLDTEAPLCFLDSLIYGRGFMVVGAPDNPGDAPIITAESPLNVAINWDPRKRMVTSAYQAYEIDGVFVAVLYAPDETIYMSREQANGSGWVIDERDAHNFGEVPVVRFANRQTTADRDGMSEITPAIMNTTDSATRSLLGMEIAREFYSIPHRYVLGADKSQFVDGEGVAKSSLDLSMNKFLAFERDENGLVPTMGQFAAFDPSVFTKIVDKHAQLMASYTQFPPRYFGADATANPASADAILAAESGVDRRSRDVQKQNSDPMERVMGLAWRFANGGADLPRDMRRMETSWANVSTPTPDATATSITKQIMAGSIPATSDVTLEALGWNAVERERLAADRDQDQGTSLLLEIAHNINAKALRPDLMLGTEMVKSNKVDETGLGTVNPGAPTPTTAPVPVAPNVPAAG